MTPTPNSNYSFGDLEILDQWPNDNDGEHSPPDLAEVSESEDEEEGYHSDDDGRRRVCQECHRVLEHQPDFLAQKSLVQETIEAAGHLCIFLPNFHCELNFIEYFWGAVKRYLREHCNYTHAGLQENLPKASVDISTIRKWEHRMIRWMEAYRGGKDAKDASLLVKQFSSRR